MEDSDGSFIVETYPDFQYCSWLVTVNESLAVLLKFVSLGIPNCEKNYIDIFDGGNDRATLLARYCGWNSTLGKTLLTTGNKVFVVLKSGNNSGNPTNYLGFHARYEAVEESPSKFLHVILSLRVRMFEKTITSRQFQKVKNKT